VVTVICALNLNMFPRLVSLLFKKEPCRIIFLGLDAAGKTTLLYKLKLGEVVTTIPTIGFNVEDVQYKNLKITCWDVGGCDKIRPLWRHYFANTTAVVFVLDSHDRGRANEAATQFRSFLLEDELRDVAVLIFANKQDMENSLSPEEVYDLLGVADLMKQGKRIHLQPCCATSGDGLYEGLDWLANTVTNKSGNQAKNSDSNNVKSDKNNDASGPPLPVPPFKSTSDKYSQEELLNKFEDCSLDTWDHKTHIRVAYANLKQFGRRQAVAKINDGIKKFIENSPIAIKTKFHVTMTYFWIQMIHFAMANTNYDELKRHTDHENPDPGFQEFDAFLEKNADLMNGGLFLQYYSKPLMFSPAAKEQFALPDVRPLPSIVAK